MRIVVIASVAFACLYSAAMATAAGSVRRLREPRPITCPDHCGMRMSAHRDRTHPVRVHYRGRTLYCCSWCSFSKSTRRLGDSP
jgi:hypothetical protein